MRAHNKERSTQIEVAKSEKRPKKSHENQKAVKESKTLLNLTISPKYFYNYCKKFSTTKIEVGPLQTEQGETTKDPNETCRLLMDKYNNVYSCCMKLYKIQNHSLLGAQHPKAILRRP